MKNAIKAHLKEMLELTDEEFVEFYESFLESLDECCLQLEDAEKTADFAKIRVAAHTLIGFTGSAGAVELHEASQKLSSVAKLGDIEACRVQINEILRFRTICHQ